MTFTRQQLTRLIVPLIIEQILAITIGMADTMMVSSVGEAAVSGISLVDSINVLIVNIFSALTAGGSVVVSQYLGRKDPESGRLASKQLVYSTLGLATVLMALSLIFRDFLLQSIFGHIEAQVMENARTYFFLTALSYPFLAVYNAGAALFRVMGNSKVSMYTSALMNIVNLIGNAALIFGFHLGVAGAAISTLAARILAAFLITGLLLNKKLPIHLENILKPEFNPGMIRSILQIGIPNGLENGMFQVGKVMVQGLVATFGTASIAANAVAGSCCGLAIIPGSAISISMITVVGHCVGAQDYEHARSYAFKLTLFANIAVTVINVFLFLGVDGIVGLYQLPPETHQLAVETISWHCLVSSILWPPAFTVPNALRAGNDARFTMVVSIFSMATFRVAFSYLLGQGLHMGLLGVWCAMYIDWLFRAIVFVTRLLRGKWMGRKLI